MLLQLAGFIFDCTCIILPKPIVHIDNYCYLYCSTLFISCTALFFILHLSYSLKKGHFENKPFIHSFIRERSTLLVTVHTFCACVYFAVIVGKLSYLVIVLMGHNYDGCQ